MPITRADALEIIKSLGSTVTMADLKPHQISISMVRSLVKSGALENPAWGVYRLPGVEESMYSEWAVVAKKYPETVVCLLSAATFHNMTQEIPGKLSVAVSHESGKRPSLGNEFLLPVDSLVWRNPLMLELGVETHLIDGTPVKITSPERTLVDLFRYSTFNKSMRSSAVRITDEMFLECLNRCNSENMSHFSFDTVAAIAREFKCYQDMQPYTKTLRYLKSEIPSL